MNNSVNASSNPSAGLTFRVERPSDWLVFKFGYERPHTWRCLNLRDPQGRVRFCHLDANNSRLAMIHRNPAYTGSLAVPGEIPAGEWLIEFAETDESSKDGFTFEWECGDGDLPADVETPAGERHYWTDTAGERNELNLYDPHESRENGPRWYKGDFHTHTVLSDGKMTPDANMKQAEFMGLDFFVATDHNLISTSWPKGKALVIPGVEYTSAHGHWNAHGITRWLDWRYCTPDGGIGTQHGMNRLMEQAGQYGALRSINHPMLTPWAWVYTETPLALIDCMEIWNDPTYDTNPAATEKALALWSVLWNEGHRVTGIGGSDSHMLPTESYREGGQPSLIGDPATFVYADRLSAASILAAVRAGRVYVSRGPTLDIDIVVDGKAFPLGSDLTAALQASADRFVRCRLTVSNLSEGRLYSIENGKEVSEHMISDAERTFEFTLDWKDANYIWRRFEIRINGGELLLFTNPIYSGSKRSEITTWRQLLEKASFEVPVN